MRVALKPRKCVQCTNEFRPKHRLQQICGPECVRARRSAYGDKYRRPVRNVAHHTNLPPNRGGDESAFLDEPEPIEPTRTKTYAEYLAQAQR